MRAPRARDIASGYYYSKALTFIYQDLLSCACNHVFSLCTTCTINPARHENSQTLPIPDSYFQHHKKNHGTIYSRQPGHL